MQSQGKNQNLIERVHMPDLAKDKRKGKELTVTLYIGGEQVQSLSSRQTERMAQRLSKTMSLYYTAHIDEYKKIKN